MQVKLGGNNKAALLAIAKAHNIEVNPKATTQDLGRRLVKEFGERAKDQLYQDVYIDGYHIRRACDSTLSDYGQVEVFRPSLTFIEALREAAANAGYDINEEDSANQIASDLIDFINGGRKKK